VDPKHRWYCSDNKSIFPSAPREAIGEGDPVGVQKPIIKGCRPLTGSEARVADAPDLVTPRPQPPAFLCPNGMVFFRFINAACHPVTVEWPFPTSWQRSVANAVCDPAPMGGCKPTTTTTTSTPAHVESLDHEWRRRIFCTTPDDIITTPQPFPIAGCRPLTAAEARIVDATNMVPRLMPPALVCDGGTAEPVVVLAVPDAIANQPPPAECRAAAVEWPFPWVPVDDARLRDHPLIRCSGGDSYEDKSGKTIYCADGIP